MNNWSEDANQPLDLVELTDENGNTIMMQVLDYFFYNGEEYVILAANVDEKGELDDEKNEVECVVMKVNPVEDADTGEELEEFVPIEDEALEEKLIEIATTHLRNDEEA